MKNKMTLELNQNEDDFLLNTLQSTSKFVDGAASKALQEKDLPSYYSFADYNFLIRQLTTKVRAAQPN